MTVRLTGRGVTWKTNLWTSEKIFCLGLIKIRRQPILNESHTILWAGSSDLSQAEKAS